MYEWASNEDYQSIFKEMSVHDVVRFYPNLERAVPPNPDNDALIYYVNCAEVAVNFKEITIDADKLTLKTDTELTVLMYHLWTQTVVVEQDYWNSDEYELCQTFYRGAKFLAL